MSVQTDSGVQLAHADPQRMQQVVSNLVSNAVKFTPPGGRIDVRTSPRGGDAAIIISDTGIGFDAEFAAHLFQPFRQADPSFRREHGGLGLGLSIARHLVELHGGSISASSPGPGQGATFVVTLPQTTANADARRRNARADYAGATT
jgi:signal transduction histidine kinase